MPKTKNQLNELGIWLNNELNKRGILLADFASVVGIAPQYLSVLTRGDKCLRETRDSWKNKFSEVMVNWPGHTPQSP